MGALVSLGILGSWSIGMEEVHHIIDQLGCQFHHILRGANDIADGLSREGVSS